MKKTKQKNFVKSKKELIKKYKFYKKELKKAEKNSPDEIPKLGTEHGNLIYRYSQAIRAIEELAERQGIKLNKK